MNGNTFERKRDVTQIAMEKENLGEGDGLDESVKKNTDSH